MTSSADDAAGLPRRDFLRIAGLGAGAVLAAPGATAAAPSPGTRRALATSTAVVVGAGIWGANTALQLARAGVKVTLVDAYGPANSRATSGDETRGIRSSYGDRSTSAELWVRWARESIVRWRAFDAEHAPRFGTRFFMTTGDVLMRETEEPFVTRSAELWDGLKVTYERVSPDDARRRWPMINTEPYPVILYEPDAGVARARASTQATVAIARDAGVELRIARAHPGAVRSEQMDGVRLDDGTVLRADAYVFACGPWLGKVFPEQMADRIRIPLGHVCYFGTPEGDTRYTVPNIPSWNVPGVTGWGALPVDSRGFRVRGALAPPRPPRRDDEDEPPPPPRRVETDPRALDPDLSLRWSSQDRIDGSRRVLEKVFPALAEAPILETRSCHYESSVNRNFIVDRLPGAANAWVVGMGQAEGFKFAPLVGEFAAKRVAGAAVDAELVEAFKFPTERFDANNTRRSEDDDA